MEHTNIEIKAKSKNQERIRKIYDAKNVFKVTPATMPIENVVKKKSVRQINSCVGNGYSQCWKIHTYQYIGRQNDCQNG